MELANIFVPFPLERKRPFLPMLPHWYERFGTARVQSDFGVIMDRKLDYVVVIRKGTSFGDIL